MARNAIIIGLLLIVLGIGFYVATMTSFTALLPALGGGVLLGCGLIGVQRPSWNKHAMHAAAAVALLVALGSLGRAVPALLSGGGGRLATIEQLIASALCLIFVGLAVRSFIAARRREA